MEFQEYVNKILEFANYIEEEGLEIYKQGGGVAKGHGYLFLLPKREIVDGKRLISENEKGLLAKVFPERFSKEYIKNSIREENNLAIFKEDEELLNESIYNALENLDKRYKEITPFDPDKDMDYKGLTPSDLEDLLEGKTAMFYYDTFHNH